MDCILYMVKGRRDILFKGTVYLLVFEWSIAFKRRRKLC